MKYIVPPMLVFFLRGLNTFGDDDLRTGPLRMGPYHVRLGSALKRNIKNNVQLVPVLGMGFGSIEDMAERAEKFILDYLSKNSHSSFHILAHSTGGLVARVLLNHEHFKSQIKTLITIGAPHLGTPAASFHERASLKTKVLLKKIKYDLDERSKSFSFMSETSMAEFNRRYPLEVHSKICKSIVCARPRRSLPWPLRLTDSIVNINEVPSDGLVPLESQKWGECIASLDLDHLEEVGVSWHFSPHERKRFQREFQKLVLSVQDVWAQHSELDFKQELL